MTYHSINRMMERGNLSYAGATQMISKALLNGKRSYELPSKERNIYGR